METIKLTHLNPSFRVKGNDKRRSLEVKSISLLEELDADTALQLLILDEKDITIFSQNLFPVKQMQQTAAEINKRFSFYDYLTVSVTAIPAGATFAVEVSFK